MFNAAIIVRESGGLGHGDGRSGEEDGAAGAL